MRYIESESMKRLLNSRARAPMQALNDLEDIFARSSDGMDQLSPIGGHTRVFGLSRGNLS